MHSITGKSFQTKVFTGKVEHVQGITSAINKRVISGDVFLSKLGLEGDECASTSFHGGVERALHHYPYEHYQYWQQTYTAFSELVLERWEFLELAGMGENISTIGLNEENICIGDQFRWGEAIIEVSQPRSPCHNLNKRWGVEKFSVTMQELSYCGWLYRVLQTGTVNASSSLELISRPENALSIKQVCDRYFAQPLNVEGLHELQSLTALSNSWQKQIEKRIKTGELENWNFRLLGHA
ncbi:MAG: MOSC domain-containing protein [Oceanospirillaceae bacterium]